MLSVLSSSMFSASFIWSPATPLHLIAFPSAKRARTFPRLSNLNESIEQSAAESKCASVHSLFWIHRQEPSKFSIHQTDLSPFSLFLTTFRVLLFWPQRSPMQKGSSGSQDHHTRAIRHPSAVGAPGSEEHQCHWIWGAATDYDLKWPILTIYIFPDWSQVHLFKVGHWRANCIWCLFGMYDCSHLMM